MSRYMSMVIPDHSVYIQLRVMACEFHVPCFLPCNEAVDIYNDTMNKCCDALKAAKADSALKPLSWKPLNFHNTCLGLGVSLGGSSNQICVRLDGLDPDAMSTRCRCDANLILTRCSCGFCARCVANVPEIIQMAYLEANANS